MGTNIALASKSQPDPDNEHRGGLVIFGDSIANGLGVGEQRFSVLLAGALSLELYDFSSSALPVSSSLEAFGKSSHVPHTAVIAHGATEAMLRPDNKCMRFLPPRWRRMGWMDPRPYYSRRWRRRIVEKSESALRWRVKNFLLKLFGGHQIMSPVDFGSHIEQLIILLKCRGARRILVVVPPDLDERYFPGSPAAQLDYFSGLSLKGAEIVDLKNRLDKWDDFFADHFHPNISGHQRIANILRGHLLN